MEAPLRQAPCSLKRAALFMVALSLSISSTIAAVCHTSSVNRVANVDLPMMVAVEAGDDIRLKCRLVSKTILNSDIAVNASNLRLKAFMDGAPFLDHSSPLVEKVDDFTVVYVKKNATVEDSAPYACFAEVDGVQFPGCIASVDVGSRPNKVHDFTCTSTHFRNMTCRWRQPNNGKVATNYTIEVIRGLNVFNQWMPCPLNLTTENSCTWTTSSDPYYEKYALNFKFRVNGTNSLGNGSWEYEFKHNEIVKLSSVAKLAFHNLTRRSVNITWSQPPETLHRKDSPNGPRNDIVYQVELRRDGAEPEIIEIENNGQLLYDRLLPNTQYNVTVRCHMAEARRLELYSDPATTTFRTPKDKPDGPPKISQSGFRYKIYNYRRTVTLMFDEIPRENWNDDAFNYIIQVCPERAFDECVNHTAMHSMTDLENLSISTRYEVTIWSNNSLGTSDRSSSIKIFTHSEILPDPSDISVILRSDSAAISWKIPELLRNTELQPSIYWCESYVDEQCNGTLHSRVLEVNAVSAVVNVSRPHDYIYGVAVTDDRTGRSSGSVWSSCVAQAGAYVGQVRDLKSEPDTDTTMRLRWSKTCNSQRKYIDGYQVEVCHIDHENAKRLVSSSDECQRLEKTYSNSSRFDAGPGTCRTENFTLADNEDEYLVEGLEKGEVYRVVVRALDKMSGRFTPDSMAVCAVAHGGWGVHMIVGIVIGGAIGLMVLVFSLYILAKWMQKKLDAAKELKVTLPAPLQKGGGAGYSDFITRLNGCNKNGIDSTFDHNHIENNIMTEFPRRGSVSSLDKLIIEKAPAVTVESSMVLANGDSRESTNLNAEPNSNEEASMEAPPSPQPNAFIVPQRANGINPGQRPGAAAMPPYTQLGLSANHLYDGVANGHGPHGNPTGNTGYSQLSVVNDAPSQPLLNQPSALTVNAGGDPIEEKNGEDSGDEDNVTDESPLQSPRRSPVPTAAPSRTGGYVSFERAMAAPVPQVAPAAPALSNGYVPVQRANQ